MKELITPKQVARAIGVSESSLKRWCDRGLIPTVRTAGGHRRLPISGVLSYLRETGHEMVRPELLGLPPSSGRGDLAIRRAAELFEAALLASDEEQALQVIFDLYLARQPLSTICDEVVAHAFHNIGDAWQCGDIQVYQERRGCEICSHVLHELRSVLTPPADDAPLAIGATPEGDVYRIPGLMIEMVLRDNGWRAESLGSGLPFESLAAAIDARRPQLFWLSVSNIADESAFLAGYQQLQQTAPPEMALVVGGQALTESLRKKMRYSAFGDNLQRLEDFVRSIRMHKDGKPQSTQADA
jgi:excisionase family DNA binding protein